MKKVISMILISLLVITYFVPVFAVNKALLYMTHYTNYYLKFSNGNEVRTAVVVYNYNGKEYPAYCVEPSKDGVGELPSYEVQFKDILNDNGLWRIVTNGYPYKTPQQMGLNNTDEAYMATKQAIYRYLAGEDETYYGGGGIGEAGKRVYNAIARLLDLGYNGTETIINATANIVQNKALNFDNKNKNYYSATYSVSSNTSYQNYTVMIDTDKSGILVTDENNNIKNKFNSGEKFKVLIPKNIVTTNFSIGVNAYLSCETKPILYGESYDPNYQDYVITTDPYEDVSTNTTLAVKKLQEDGKLIIYKKDNETKAPIKGVSFELYKDNRIVARGTTDSKGELTFSNLDEGSYVVKETATNSNYILNTNSKEVEIPFNGTKEITIENEHKKGNLKIYKLDKDNQKIGLSGVVFELYSHEFDKVIGTYTTNADGEILIENLRTGDYTLHEISTDKWYNLAEDVEVKIKYNETTEVAVYNELKKGQIKVVKIDADENNIPIEGVKFNVMTEDGEILETITTDKNGEATSDRIPIRYKNVYLQEIETNKNYILNDEIIKIELQEDKIISKTVENESKKGKIQVIKKDFDNKELGVEGVVFDIICEQTGKVVDTITTDKNGIATSKDLSILYTYTLVEVSTDKKYNLNTEPITNLETEYKNTLQIEITNEKKKGQIKIIKKDIDNRNIPLAGVVFDILDENGNIVDTVVTDARGEALTKMLPSIDTKYTIREKITKQEYVLSDELHIVTLQENKIKPVEIFNEKIKGRLQITKVDGRDNSKRLEGVVFGVYNENNELVQEIVTNTEGIATSELLPYGKYYCKELETGSKYYLLNEENFEFEIKTDDEIIEKTYINEPVTPEVDIEKEGTIETKPNEIVDYTFYNIENKSNIYLEQFKWIDYIPTDYVRLETMTTGTWNQDLKYDVYYKTNKSDEYILFKEDLDTKENYNLDFREIQPDNDEYITETYFDFGRVDVGFKEVEKPTMKCRTLDTLQNDDTFTNKTKTVGIYGEITVESKTTWTTLVHVPEKPKPTLPDTGK